MSKAKLLTFVTLFTSAYAPLSQASDCYTFTAEGPNRIGKVSFPNPAKTLCISMYVQNQYSLLFISDKYALLGEANCTLTEKSKLSPGANEPDTYVTGDGKSSIKFSLQHETKSLHATGTISIDGRSYPAIEVHE